MGRKYVPERRRMARELPSPEAIRVRLTEIAEELRKLRAKIAALDDANPHQLLPRRFATR